ncbi:MAG: polymer-forming cytoskeletal protein [Rubrivivax sp.]|jgi:cytoskeletal protein CcmA (bactofilin family)|nr:polymer-forming cytoskeletal protein [Rubrivivax sp.]MBK7264330.1 polymer-forming cytoskeletal protein [Rubrivivax sp.]
MWFAKRKALPIRSLIGEGAVLHGNLSFADGLRIDGEVHGNVIATTPTSLLVISEKARVLGEVKGGHVIINGEVRGPVHASDLLELQPKAQVSGNVRYELLEMHQGAMIDGELRPLKMTDKPALILAASNDA